MIRISLERWEIGNEERTNRWKPIKLNNRWNTKELRKANVQEQIKLAHRVVIDNDPRVFSTRVRRCINCNLTKE